MGKLDNETMLRAVDVMEAQYDLGTKGKWINVQPRSQVGGASIGNMGPSWTDDFFPEPTNIRMAEGPPQPGPPDWERHGMDAASVVSLHNAAPWLFELAREALAARKAKEPKPRPEPKVHFVDPNGTMRVTACGRDAKWADPIVSSVPGKNITCKTCALRAGENRDLLLAKVDQNLNDIMNGKTIRAEATDTGHGHITVKIIEEWPDGRKNQTEGYMDVIRGKK